MRRFARVATVEDMLRDRLRRDSVLDGFKAYLHQQWNAGITDAARLTQEITDLGYRGSDKTVRRYLHPLRASGLPAPPPVPTPPTVRQVTGWLTRRPEDVAEADALTLKQITARCPALESTQEFVRDFAKMLTQLAGHQLPEWLDRVDREGGPELRSFADSLRRDLAAVTAGLSCPLSDRESAELVAEATGLMTQLLAMLPDARSSEELTGVEGAAARAYFGALGVLMPAGLT